MERRSQSGGLLSVIGLLIVLFLLIVVGLSDAYKTEKTASVIPNQDSNLGDSENKVWAVLPVLTPTLTEPKHVTEPAPVTRRRRSKFPRESGRLRRLSRRQFQRTGTTPATSYHTRAASSSAFRRNGMVFHARSIKSPSVYCPPGCVCFKAEVECKYANLHHVPEGISSQTEKL
ncbi:unnamed protein product [Echinostoma caproni]|uniref:LRRNT domain-containing protein n=1 Tax=Echinostoma caproni TaxID=27848 RepID=A0A183A5H2_9TREM|nr:unnamed protein product [Echinostoma caproni]